MLGEQNLSSQSYLVPSKTIRTNIRKHIYQSKRTSNPVSSMTQNRSHTSFNQYEYQLKAKLLVEQKLQKKSTGEQSKQKIKNNIKFKAVEEYLKTKKSFVPKKFAFNLEQVIPNSGAFVGSMKKSNKNIKGSKSQRKNVSMKNTSPNKSLKRGSTVDNVRIPKSRQFISQLKLVVNKTQLADLLQNNKTKQKQEDIGQEKTQDCQIQSMIASDVRILKTGKTMGFQIYLLKLKRQEDRRKTKYFRKWENFPQKNEFNLF